MTSERLKAGAEDDIAEDIFNLLDVLCDYRGIDRQDENLKETPQRVAKALLEITEGYEQDPEEILSKSFPSDDYDQMIVVKDIDYFSTCAHHLMSFYGKVAVGYIPSVITEYQEGPNSPVEKKGGKVVGLSKIPRLVRAFSRRLQIQERMTRQIADAMQEHLNPRGVGVVVYDSIHLCSHMRGIEERHSTMETSTLYGEFRNDPAVRAEFFSMIYGGRR